MADDIDEPKRLLRDDSDDEEESGDDELESCGKKLPWGVRKKIIEAAPASSSSAKPRIGDEVLMTFVAQLQDGKEISSSKDEKKPYRFVLGSQPRQVVEGLELGVKTMKRGEIAQFTIAPRFAYDDLGSPPLIPPDTTLVFEVKLLSWEAKVDLFQDDRAVKTIVERGSGEEKPQVGQEVLLSVTVNGKGGQVLDQHTDVDHVVGSPDFGLASKIVSQALQHMVEGERSSVRLRRFAGDTLVDRTLQGATIELYLQRVFEVRDVSPHCDGSVQKKLLRKGTAEKPPAEASAVRARLSSGDVEKLVEFHLGDGEVCDELEAAVAEMRLGEESLLRCQKLFWAKILSTKGKESGNAGCDCENEGGHAQEERAVLRIELQAAEGPATEDRLAFAAARKEVAAGLFRRQRHWLALKRYDWILVWLEGDDAEASVQMCLTCQLNRAACLLQLGDSAAARTACDAVLAQQPDHVKALYRRASASFALSDYSRTQKDIAQVLRLDPRNGDARALYAKLREAQKRYAQDTKVTVAKMWGQQPPECPDADLPSKQQLHSSLSPSAVLRLAMPCLNCFPLPQRRR